MERAQRQREATQRSERDAQERVQRQREATQRSEREALETADRLTREIIENEATDRRARDGQNSELATILEDRIIEESKDITEQEVRLQKRKRSLRDSIEKIPTHRRARIDTETSTIVTAPNAAAECVICHTSPSSRAIIPCGHHCLCDDCAVTLVASSPAARLCPLCRGGIQSTLRIYSSS